MSMSDPDSVSELIEEHDVQFVDFRFTDPRGKWQHTDAGGAARSMRTCSPSGIMFDGSSIAGLEGDLTSRTWCLMPDPASRP